MLPAVCPPHCAPCEAVGGVRTLSWPPLEGLWGRDVQGLVRKHAAVRVELTP